MHLSRRLVRALNEERKAIPERIALKTRLHILDNLAIMIAARRSPLAQTVLDGIAAGGCSGGAHVVGGAERLPPALAAFANASLAHIMDYDDIHDVARIHPSSVTLPAALAAGELAGARGDALLDAVALGNELTCRLGYFLSPTGKGPGADWFLSQFFGYLGGCYAAGLLLGLDEERMAGALGIAYMQIAGGKEPAFATGANTRAIYPGFAAQGAVQSALLARAGMIGPASALEGTAGLFPLYFGLQLSEADAASLLEPGVWRWEAANAKPYPCCRSSHTSVSIALELHERIAGRPVEKVEVAVNARAGFLCRPMDERRRPRTLADAKYSIPYMVAFALVHGRVDLTNLVDGILEDAEVKALADRLTVSDHLPDRKGLAPSEIAVTLADGTVEKAVFGGSLVVSEAGIRDKFRSCMVYAGRDDLAADGWERLQNLREMTVAEIIGAFAAPAARAAAA